jgi:hypothetical protein
VWRSCDATVGRRVAVWEAGKNVSGPHATGPRLGVRGGTRTGRRGRGPPVASIGWSPGKTGGRVPGGQATGWGPRPSEAGHGVACIVQPSSTSWTGAERCRGPAGSESKNVEWRPMPWKGARRGGPSAGIGGSRPRKQDGPRRPCGLGSPGRGSQVTELEGGPDGGNTVGLSQKVPHRAGGRREADWLAGLHWSRQPEEANQSS